MSQPDFLQGYRVLDLSQYIPGPFATRQLSDLGADVIKIEPPHGDPMQYFMMPDRTRQSPLYQHLNRGKRIVRLDLKSEPGKAIFRNLLQDADVLMESFRPGVMQRLGFGKAELQAINPRLVHCALSGFGQSGPYRDRAGHDLTYCAIAGVLSSSGTMERPTLPFPPIADHAGAMQAVNAIQAALLGRERSGKGAHLDISLYESALAWQYLTLDPSRDIDSQQRESGMLNGGLACYNIYQTQDGRFVALAPLEEKFWIAFCETVKREAWIPRHYEVPLPQTALINELRALFLEATAAEWQERLEDCDCCFEVIPTPAELPQQTQTLARGLLSEWEPAYPAYIDDTPCSLNSAHQELDAASQIHWLASE